MFAPAVIPIEITFWILLVALIGLPFVLKRFTKHPVLSAFGICAVASIPTLLVVGEVVDSIRYGKFNYKSPAEIGEYTFWILPDRATDISMHKYASGHEIKFKATKLEVEDWMAQMNERQLEYSDNASHSRSTTVPARNTSRMTLGGEAGFSRQML